MNERKNSASDAKESNELWPHVSQSDFYSVLAHDLRNPLTPILVSINLLKFQEQSSQRLKAVSTIEREARRLNFMLEDLQYISHLMRQDIQPFTSSFPLQEAAENAMKKVKPLLKDTGSYVNLHLPDTALLVQADQNQIIRIIFNLLRFSIRKKKAGEAIRLEASDGQKAILLRLQFNGADIPSEDLPHLFDLYRPPRSGRQKSKGHIELCLYLVKKFAEMNGGRIEAKKDGGAIVFSAHLPKATQSPDPTGK